MCNANYMDGVPVKIAEKYKPPPAIYKLPQLLANKLNLDENYYRDCPVFSYDLQLEKKALSKIEQWKRIRQREKEVRIDRISKREAQRKREYEDRQKNLLYSVSYPSADDLSSGEEEEKYEVDIHHIENGKTNIEPKETAPQICMKETVNSFHNILQPTVLSNDNSSSNGTSTLKPFLKSTFESKLSTNSFNYKDFEDDTSSPFDNIELKTINDLDVLAQVLHNTQIKSPAANTPTDNAANTSSNNTDDNPNNCNPQLNLSQKLNTDLVITAENIPKPKNNLPRFNHDFNSTQGALTQNSDRHIKVTPAMHYNENLSVSTPNTASPQHLYNGLNNTNNYYYQPNHCSQNTNNVIIGENCQLYGLQALTEDQGAKSKSVPDILKELRDEIRNSEIRRYRNCSYNMEESTENNDVCPVNKTTKNSPKNADKSDMFSHLDSKAKHLVEKISVMGFPLERVVRIVQLIGTDDKKVIEHLIPLSELADLGFDENKISEALIRNENNKNKALEDLIS